ncbi:Domain of uncharacterised function (DUF397) [Mycobacterium tuberculosis]|nr:Domain of uncharacterised function (DUF397) [Mycobacterium tuberculosis]
MSEIRDPMINNASLTWRKSTRTQANGQCVELAQVHEGCAVRDSKDPAGPVLTFTTHEWSALLKAIKTGTHDLP